MHGKRKVAPQGSERASQGASIGKGSHIRCAQMSFRRRPPARPRANHEYARARVSAESDIHLAMIVAEAHIQPRLMTPDQRSFGDQRLGLGIQCPPPNMSREPKQEQCRGSDIALARPMLKCGVCGQSSAQCDPLTHIEHDPGCVEKGVDSRRLRRLGQELSQILRARHRMSRPILEPRRILGVLGLLGAHGLDDCPSADLSSTIGGNHSYANGVLYRT